MFGELSSLTTLSNLSPVRPTSERFSLAPTLTRKAPERIFNKSLGTVVVVVVPS